MTVENTAGDTALASAQGRWILLATVLASGMAGIDATVVNIALPTMGRDLDATFAGLQWTVSGYTLTLAALILWGGATGDRIGRRRALVLGTTGFAGASLLCAVAPGIGFLVAARVLQGAAGALLTPASLALIEVSIRPQDRVRAVGTWAGFSGIATAVAPFLGGWLLSAGSWRWVFVINLPLSALVAAVALRHLPESRSPRAEIEDQRHGDWRGSALAVLGLGAITYALISADTGTWVTSTLIGAAGVLALAGFVVVENRTPRPLVPVELFRSLQFSTANATTFLVYGAIGVFFFLLVIELQVVSGYSPLAAGSSLLPVTALTLLLSARSGQIAQRIGPRVQMTLGPLLCAAGVLLTLRLTAHTDYWRDVFPVVTLFGLGLATLVAPLTATALGAAPDAYAGVASGVNNAVARSGSLLAIAALPVVVGLTGDTYEVPAEFLAGFHRGMWVVAAVLVTGALLAAAGIREPIGVSTQQVRGAVNALPHACS